MSKRKTKGYTCNLYKGKGKLVPPEPEVTVHGGTKIHSAPADDFVPRLMINEVLEERKLLPGEVFFMRNYDRNPSNLAQHFVHILLCIYTETRELTEEEKGRARYSK